MVLVHGLGPVNRSEDDIWEEELRQTNEPLDENENIRHQSYLTMSTLESSLRVGCFVHFDDHKASD